MPLTNVDLSRIDGTVGSISTASINNIKNASSGSNNIVLNSDGTTTLTPSNIIKSGTAAATTSGVAVDFTGIPSWVKRVTVMFDGVSTNGTSLLRIQLGDSGGIETSGYNGATSYSGGGGAGGSFNSAGFDTLGDSLAALLRYGFVVFTNLSGNIWTAQGMVTITGSGTPFTMHISGAKTLSATLDRVRITTVNGTDTFDAGSVNILYEG